MADDAGIDLDRLSPGTRLRLPGSGTLVELLHVRPGTFWELTYRGEDGPGVLTLAEDELDQLELVKEPDRGAFDTDPRLFRLGIEARRIQIAFAHDMAALAVSNIQPLPHQLEAVYGEFLTQPRLRFLLADDAGAGKTIMAGLYMKELELRKVGDRILVVSPANLRPQWTRELEERFQLQFQQFGSSHFESVLSGNPWDQYDRIIVSRDFLKQDHILEAFEAADREWDLAVIDEAHGLTVHTDGRGFIKDRSQRYKAGEVVAREAHRLLLMTATPHSGKNESLWGLLRLLDQDVYGDRCPDHLEVPDRLYRKVPKEKMKDMSGNDLFKDRHPHTLDYDLEGPEKRLYDAVTDFVQNKLRDIRSDRSRSAAGFALTTMQRRLASSVRAIRRTLERRLERIERGLEDPEEYLRTRQAFRDDVGFDEEEFEELPEAERWRREERALAEWLPMTVEEFRAERDALIPLLDHARETEETSTERKLTELLDVVHSEGLRDDRREKLLIFTEHKDTLDFLVEELSPDFEVATIHGGLKLRDRIAQEKHFRERAQILVATEAAGEGINLQFCHLMVNYDIPWNPNRLEQRMGRIHRIGQTRDVHIFNLVAANTREGRVLRTLLRKLEAMKVVLGDGVFDVIGRTFADFRLRDLIEDVLAGDISSEEAVTRLGGEEADPEIQQRAQQLMQKALARDHVDWKTEQQQWARAQERRLPPGYFERFFEDGLTLLGGDLERRLDPGTLRVTRTPNRLVAASRASSLSRLVHPSYPRLTFDKQVAAVPAHAEDLPEAELCGPGHPLFDAIVDAIVDRTSDRLGSGAFFFDPSRDRAELLHFLSGDFVDANDELVHRRLITVRTHADGRLQTAADASLYDLLLPDDPSEEPDEDEIPEWSPQSVIDWARKNLLEDIYQDQKEQRADVADIQQDFVQRSFAAVLADLDDAILSLDEDVEDGATGAEGRLRKAELARDQQVYRRDRRLGEIERSRTVLRGPVRFIGSALVLPLPESTEEADDSEGSTPTRNEDIEQIAVQAAWEYEEDRGADTIESVERDNIGFDLLSLKGLERRCIEVKGRAGVGLVELTWSEFEKAQEIGDDYWLYVVLDCATANPRLYRIQDPANALVGRIRPTLNIRYRVEPDDVIETAEDGT